MKRILLIVAVVCFIPLRPLTAENFAKIRAKTMIVPKAMLVSLRDDPNVEDVYFNHYYNNRGFAKDQVLLTAHIVNKQNKLQTVIDDLESTNFKGERFDKELRYSVYRVTKADAKKILSHSSEFSGATYFLLEPRQYSDKRYLCYRILPADASKKEIIAMVSNGVNSLVGINLQPFRQLYLNPSPPAGSSLEEQ